MSHDHTSNNVTLPWNVNDSSTLYNLTNFNEQTLHSSVKNLHQRYFEQISLNLGGVIHVIHYDGKTQSFNPGLQYPHLHGPVHTPDNNRWVTPPV